MRHLSLTLGRVTPHLGILDEGQRPFQVRSLVGFGVKVFTVVGNRPQFIKAAPLSAAMREVGIDEVVRTRGSTGTTRSQVFFDQLGLAEPRYRLELHTGDIERMQPEIARIAAESPDIVLVYGDTNSTLAGARAAADASIPLAHVEAGLRSGDLSMPEEHNRIETDRLAWLLFCPDHRSRRTLEDEGAMDGSTWSVT